MLVGQISRIPRQRFFYHRRELCSRYQDATIPFTGSWTLVNGLAKELGLEITVPYRSWFEGKQVGGWTQVYGNNQLPFASIRGASHTAPSTQPARSFSLSKAFLSGEPLPNA